MLQASFDFFKAELLRSSRRSTQDAHAPPLSRLRSFQKLRTSSNGEGSDIYTFKSTEKAQVPLEAQNFENLQSQVALLEKSYDLVARAVAMMVGPSNASMLEQQADGAIHKGTGPKGHSAQARDVHRDEAQTTGRTGNSREGRPDPTYTAVPDLAGLQDLISSGAVRRKMDHVEPNVFAVLVSKHAVVLDVQATPSRHAHPARQNPKEVQNLTSMPSSVQNACHIH